MTAYEKSLWMIIWPLDYENNKIFPNGFDDDYFKGLVADGTITADDFKTITGKDYVAAQATEPRPANA